MLVSHLSPGRPLPLLSTTSREAAFCLNNRAVRVGHALCLYFTGKIISSWSGFYISLVATRLTVRFRITQSWSTYRSHSELCDITLPYSACVCVCTCVWAVPLWVILLHSVSKLNSIKHVRAATYHLTEWSGWIEQYFNQQRRRRQRCSLEGAEAFPLSLTIN